MPEDTVLEAPPATPDTAAVSPGPSVRFRGWRGGLLVQLPAEHEWSVVCEALGGRMAVARDFWEGAPATVDLGDRELSDAELAALSERLRDEFGLEPAGVVATSATVRDIASRLGLESHAELPAAPAKAERLDPREQTRYFKGTVRSGTVIDSTGNLVIIGDVNAGAEIRAGGDIVVMGTLRGVAHAGYRGDLSALILAINLRPTQIRIGDLIARAPDGGQPPLSKFPEKAMVENGEIHVLPV